MSWLLALALAAPLPDIDFDAYMQPAPPPVDCTGLDDSPTRIVDGGFLVAECEFARIIDLRADHKRLLREVDALVTLRRKEHEVWDLIEAEYNRTVLSLRPNWWERHAWAIGVVAGAIGTAAIVAAAR